jgi:hypothetical protein
MANINKLFPNRFMSARDMGGELTLTIDRVEMQEFGEDSRKKPVVKFTDEARGFVLNKTNAKCMADIFGTPETDDWSGKSIVLRKGQSSFEGKTVDTIRVHKASAEYLQDNGDENPY